MKKKIVQFYFNRKFESKPFKSNNKIRKNKKNFPIFPLAKFLDIGYYLIIPILLGLIIGFLIDSYFKTQPFFTIFLIFLGMVSSFYNLWRLVNKISNSKYQ